MLDTKTSLCTSVEFLSESESVDRHDLVLATQRATRNGTTAADELLAEGAITHETYAMELARHSGCRYLSADDVQSVLSRSPAPSILLQPSGLRWCRLHDGSVMPVSLAEPRMTGRLLAHVEINHMADSLCIMSYDQFKLACLKQYAETICSAEANRLYEKQPMMSARFGANFTQGLLLPIFIAALIFAFLTGPSLTALVLHIALSLFFAGCVVTRLVAAMQPKPKAQPTEPSRNEDKPVYTVLVALLDEQDLVPGLIKHLSALSWPASKLEIKLICEEDDHKTIQAIERVKPDRRFEIIQVPDIGPRTKPKALSYALPFTTGQLITLYDAEDRPHPMQLEQAWQTFRDADEKLACLQAPLMITNAQRNVLTALFHIEYAGLFRKLLPWLSKMDCPLPLGGTSNHFRRNALLDVGGWDPFNVTEDADLGHRLWRAGFRTGTITLPTLEDAPRTIETWVPQRTRWLKGWMQTWLVHSRHPGQMIQRAGYFRFLIAHIMLTGVVGSSLLHPLMLLNAIVFSVWMFTSPLDFALVQTLAVLDWTIVLLSYFAFCVIGWAATGHRLRGKIWPYLFWTPVYWMIMSYACWRALVQLFRQTYLWEKTPHEVYDPIHPHGR